MLKAIVDNWYLAARGGIDSPIRGCHFLAQKHTETAGFTVLEENLNYSAKRLTQVWPKRFPTLESAKPFERNPRALANKVYGGRMGNTEPDDGWLYRGRGFAQLTGKDNYRRIGRKIGRDLLADPDLVLDGEVGFTAAVAYWQLAGCNKFADANDIRGVTRAINGGYNGLADRRAAFRKAVEIWGDGTFSEKGGKGPLASTTGKASLLGGGAAALGTLTETTYQVREVLAGTREASDMLGVPLLTLVLGLVAVGAVGWILYDRYFIYRNEGL